MEFMNKTFDEYLEHVGIEKIYNIYYNNMISVMDNISEDIISNYIQDEHNNALYIDYDENKIIPNNIISKMNESEKDIFKESLNDIESYDNKVKYMFDTIQDNKDNFKKWCLKHISNEIKTLKEDLIPNIESNKIKLYRGMSVKGELDFEKRYIQDEYIEIGKCWSYDKIVAEDFSGKATGSVIVEALIDEKDVNWKTTLELALFPKENNDEKELRLYHHAIIEVKIIETKQQDGEYKTHLPENKKYFIAEDEIEDIYSSTLIKEQNKDILNKSKNKIKKLNKSKEAKKENKQLRII